MAAAAPQPPTPPIIEDLNMIRGRIAPVVGLSFVLLAGCMDSSQGDVGAAADALREAANELRGDVRSALDDAGQRIERLDERYMSASEEVAADWSDSRAEMREYSQGLEADLAELETAGEEEAVELKREIAEDLEQLTERVERAQLESFETGEEFVSASRDRMVQLEQDFQELEGEAASLSEEGRADASRTMDGFNDRAGELGRQLQELAGATAEEIDEERDDIAQGLSSLTASVRRELFEMRQAVTE